MIFGRYANAFYALSVLKKIYKDAKTCYAPGDYPTHCSYKMYPPNSRQAAAENSVK